MNPTSQDPVSQLLSIRSEGVITFNQEGLVNYTSPLFLTLAGASAAELHGLTESEFSHWLTQRSQSGAPFSGISLLRERALLDPSRRREVIEISQGSQQGTLLDIEWFSGHSEDIADVLFVRDVSVVSSREQAKQKFISTAAHDLRSPLASIAGFTEVLQTQDLDAQSQKDFLQIMADQAEHLTQLMSSVFELARMDAQQGKDYRFVRCTLQSLLDEVVASFKLPTERARPVVVMPSQPLWLMADPSKLKQAIHQVLANAYQYSPQGGAVQLEVSCLKKRAQADRVCLQVTDLGVGMTTEQTLRICERFYHLSTVGTTAGRGLGMALAKKIIQRHHGDLRVTSTPQQGTQVVIELLLAAKQD